VLTAKKLMEAVVVREPPGTGFGYWAGAPGAYYDAREKAFYLSYRLRRPRGVTPDRGSEVRIARSEDGLNFRDLWSITKDAVGTASMERSALVRGHDETWRLFLSFVDPADSRWCTGVLAAPRISDLFSSKPRIVLTAAECGKEGVKDPFIVETQGCFAMMLSVATATSETSERSHATADIYSTGQCRSETALAFSDDLEHWSWQGVVFRVSPAGWDRYCRRLTGLLRVKDRWLAFYDGSASHRENYEEKAGMAGSRDLVTWRSLTPGGPLVPALPGSASLRYVDVLRVGADVFLYCEICRADGAHELRALCCRAEELSGS
jgi:hypothetical protein